MIVCQEKPTFKSITLVLETELEAEIIKALAGTVNSCDLEIGGIVGDLHHQLEMIGISNGCGNGRDFCDTIDASKLRKYIEEVR